MASERRSLCGRRGRGADRSGGVLRLRDERGCARWGGQRPWRSPPRRTSTPSPSRTPRQHAATLVGVDRVALERGRAVGNRVADRRMQEGSAKATAPQLGRHEDAVHRPHPWIVCGVRTALRDQPARQHLTQSNARLHAAPADRTVALERDQPRSGSSAVTCSASNAWRDSRVVAAASGFGRTWNWHQQFRADASAASTDWTAGHPATDAGTTLRGMRPR